MHATSNKRAIGNSERYDERRLRRPQFFVATTEGHVDLSIKGCSHQDFTPVGYQDDHQAGTDLPSLVDGVEHGAHVGIAAKSLRLDKLKRPFAHCGVQFRLPRVEREFTLINRVIVRPDREDLIRDHLPLQPGGNQSMHGFLERLGERGHSGGGVDEEEVTAIRRERRGRHELRRRRSSAQNAQSESEIESHSSQNF